MNATSQYLNHPLRTFLQYLTERRRLGYKIVKRFNPPIEPLESLDP